MILVQGYVGEKPVVADWGKSKLIFGLQLPGARAGGGEPERHHVLTCSVRPAGDGHDGELDGSGIPRYDVPVPAGDHVHAATLAILYRAFVQCVTAAGGSTPIATNDAKITCEGLHWPVSNA